MTAEVTTFRWVPPFAQGYVRDLRIRWALEEARIPYEVALIDAAMVDREAYRQRQPFGQVPAYRDDEVEMFESGAVVLHLAAKSDALAPVDAAGRARVATWVLAALNSVEPHVQNYNDAADSEETWAAARLPAVEAMLTQRLEALSAWLGDRPYLEDGFTAGDLIMTTVLRELVDSGVLARYPNLDAYRKRCEDRPAFGKALGAQLALYRETAPA
jgi:glutathione S-transferase